MAASAAAQALVVKELLLQEAVRLGVEGSREEGEAGQVEAAEDAAIRQLIDREIDIPVATDDECRRYFGNNGSRFRSEPIYEARHILLPALASNKTMRREARELAHVLIKELVQDNGSFDEFAREHSACPSSQQGGNLGQITKGTTVPEFEAALVSMAEGELRAEPVESPVWLSRGKTRPQNFCANLPFEHVRERIAAWLEAASWSRAVAQYVGILAAEAEIKGVELAVSDGPLVQ